MRTLILPGIGSSGPQHWQTIWEGMDATCSRVHQSDWDAPCCADWVSTLDGAIADGTAPVVFVAHSSSCALVAHWARTATATRLARVHSALLVAPSDPDGPNYPIGPSGFTPVPLEALPFRTIVVASTNDVYVTIERAAEYAAGWGSTFVNVGAAGHINAASELGSWPFGYALLESLRQ